jgi:putative transposase
VILSHKIRLVPTLAQEGYFQRACGTARFTYNWALAAWKQAYEAGEKPSGRSLKLQFNALRKAQFPWTYEVHRDCTAGAFDRIQGAFQGFFRRIKAGGEAPGYPKFKKKGLAKDSFSIANDKFSLNEKQIRIPKLGWVKMRETLRFSGKIMSAVVSRTADKWFVAIAVDTEVTSQPPKTKGAVGVDLGISTLATMSDGRKIQHSNKREKLEKQVKRLQKSVSRKQKGSASRRKAVVRLARKHLELTNLRNDLLHKLTTGLVQDYEPIVIEDLNVKGMVKNHHLARSISRQAWSEFRRQIDYKSKMYGRTLLIANRFYPSSKTCSECSFVNKEVVLGVDSWVCPACGVVHDRDFNAAINLSKLPLGKGKVKPVEREALAGRSLASETALCEAGTGLG